jgi:CheY-like chemotaxis protein
MVALLALSDSTCADVHAAVAVELGLRPVRAMDGEQALVALARWGNPKLAVVGLELPLIDGFGVLERLHALSPRPRIIAVSPFRALRGFAAYAATRLGIDVVLAPQTGRASVARTSTALLAQKLEVFKIPREPSKPRLRAVRPHEPGVAPPDSRLGWFVDRVARELGVEAAMARVELDDGRLLVATSGLDARESRRAEPFYRLVVEASAPLVVPDAPRNPFFQEEPSVRAGHVRGYAGCPLFDESGRTRGSLSVFTARARMPLDACGMAGLAERASQVGQVLSYLGGRTVPRDDGAPSKATSERMQSASNSQVGWGAYGFEEAPTEPNERMRW